MPTDGKLPSDESERLAEKKAKEDQNCGVIMDKKISVCGDCRKSKEVF